MTSRCSSSLSAGECRSPAIAGEADQLRDRMSHSSRRDVFKAALAGASATAFLGRSVPAAPAEPAEGAPAPGRGVEGQRKADLGDGTFLNPIVAGDHPDPTILKDGDDYYMTFSSFFSYPGAVIWHSRDLVNWAPSPRPQEAAGFCVGDGSRQPQRPLLHLHSGESERRQFHLRRLRRRYPRPLERADRSENRRLYRSWTCRRRRRQALPVLQWSAAESVSPTTGCRQRDRWSTSTALALPAGLGR